ncbi:hypothetical protein AAMO2058_001065000 [Amorphochlora amoebiformis]
MMRHLLGPLLISLAVPLSAGKRSSNLWRHIPDPYSVHPLGTADANSRPTVAKHFHFDIELAEKLFLHDGGIIDIPIVYGKEREFEIVEFRLKDTTLLTMEEGLAKKFPKIKTYHAKQIGGNMSAEFDIGHHGFHAQIFSVGTGLIYIDPFSRGKRDLYSLYTYREFMESTKRPKDHKCGTVHDDDHGSHSHIHDHMHLTKQISAKLQDLQGTISTPSSSKIRTYRIALVANGEYSNFHGNTIASVSSALVTAMNRVNGIYKREVGVIMTLIANNNQLICLNLCASLTNGGNYLNEIGPFIDSRGILSSEYDIGHGFSTGAGGVAGLGVVCTNIKYLGVTGSGVPTNDAYWVDYVSHEIGHQFNGDHTFNGARLSCGTQRASSNAYEPGSGSTIQAYAGICAADNLQTNSDPYFHLASLEQFQIFIESGFGSTCGSHVDSANNIPTVTVGTPSMTIPRNQPFRLDIGSSGDTDSSDFLAYCWEQIDLGPQAVLESPSGTNTPRFRSYSPTFDTFRWVPLLNNVLAGATSNAEQLPTASGILKFAVTVRDHWNPNFDLGIGTWNADKMTISVNNVGPLTVTNPSSSTTWTEGASRTISWNVASTSSIASTIDIAISLDNGATFSTTLASGVSNTGSHTFSTFCTGIGISGASYSGYLMIRSSPINGNYWYAVSPLMTFAGSPACSATSRPTNYPTPAPFTGPPTLLPTATPPTPAPTPVQLVKVEFTCDFASVSYPSIIGDNTAFTAFESSVKNTVSLAAFNTSSRTNDVVVRYVRRTTPGIDTGITMSAHADFQPGSEESLTSSFLSTLQTNPQSVFSSSNMWDTSTYGSVSNVEAYRDTVTAPQEACTVTSNNKCHFVAWEPWHGGFTQSLSGVRPSDQVIFYWTGDESVHQFLTQLAYQNCDFSSAPKLTSAADELNRHYTWTAPSVTSDTEYYFGANNSTNHTSIGSFCLEGLKIAITVSLGSSGGGGGNGNNAGIIAGAVIGVIVGLIIIGVFIWYCSSSKKESQAQTIPAKHFRTKTRKPSARGKSPVNAVPMGVALPPGWTMHYSDGGIPYYHNARTGESRWEQPRF